MNLVKKIKIKYQMLTRKASFSLNELDIKLAKYMNYDFGFFIEAGANDGVNQSNTLYFEKYKKWKGILIEPIPELAKVCELNRPNCIVENCALVSQGFTDSHIEMHYSNLMSLVRGAMRSEEEEIQHVIKGCQLQGIESYKIKVPARTLTSILEQHRIQKVDFLSLDVEGFELNVLQGLDFEKYKPNWMLIEARYRNEIDSFLRPIYEPIAELSHHDVLYKSREMGA